MSSETGIPKLNEKNYHVWAAETEDYLCSQGLWLLVTGEEDQPAKPRLSYPVETEEKLTIEKTQAASGSAPSAATGSTAEDPLIPESYDATYLARFDMYVLEYKRWKRDRLRAVGTIMIHIEPHLKVQYRNDSSLERNPQALWDKIKTDRQVAIQPHKLHLERQLYNVKISSHHSVKHYNFTITCLINDLAACGLTTSDEDKIFYLLNGLPRTREWEIFETCLRMNNKDTTVDSVISEMEFFERHQRAKRGLPI